MKKSEPVEEIEKMIGVGMDYGNLELYFPVFFIRKLSHKYEPSLFSLLSSSPPSLPISKKEVKRC
ncbi:MAG: hypothetical protein ABH886_05210 [Candidatus Desantisbacteria bacterium]